jgi:hypothetical protein
VVFLRSLGTLVTLGRPLTQQTYINCKLLKPYCAIHR